MAALTGDDQEWQQSGYGVLGTATPRAFVDQVGTSHDLDGYGVWGLLGSPTDNAGVIDELTSNWQGQPVRAAIVGRNTLSDRGVAVLGEWRVPQGLPTCSGFLAGRNPIGGEQTGVFGQGPRGVVGVGQTADGTGVVGTSGGTGVLGFSSGSAGIGVHGINGAGGLAGKFDGNVQVGGKFIGDASVEANLNVGANLNVAGDVLLNNGDIAERFEVGATARCDPGMVVTIGSDGTLVPCNRQYDKRVVGVISGAGPLKPALTLRHASASTLNAVVALVGTVYCLADADAVAIESGDLLTASETCGHAMKASDPLRSFGAVIGKALAPLEAGRGLIPMLVALQ